MKNFVKEQFAFVVSEFKAEPLYGILTVAWAIVIGILLACRG